MNITTDSLSIISYESSDFAKYTKGREDSLKKGIALACQYASGSPSFRYDTFVGKTQDEIVNEAWRLLSDERMMDVERKFAAKIGNLDRLPYELWRNKVIALWPSASTFNPDENLLRNAINAVRKEVEEGLFSYYGSKVLTPISVEDCLPLLTVGKNSGYPFFSPKWGDKDENGNFLNKDVIDYYTKSAKSLLNGVDTISGTPFVLLCRTQNDGAVAKQRPIEAPSKTETIAAKCFHQVLIQSMKDTVTYYGFRGGGEVGRIMPELLAYDTLFEGDFSAFDTTCGPLMPYVFQLLKELSDHKYDTYFDIVERFYKEAQVLTPEGLVSGPNAGLMSGAGWTSVIGTLCNSIATKYTMSRMGLGENDYCHLAYGDDIAIGCSHDIDEAVFENVMLEINMVCNKQKQSKSSGPKARVSFLGYYYFKEEVEDVDGMFPYCKGHFPLFRTLNGLIYRTTYAQVESLCQESGVNLQKIKDAGGRARGVDMLSYVMKLTNLRNLVDFEKIVHWFMDNEPMNLASEVIFPWENLQKALRVGRTNGGDLKLNPVAEIVLQREGLFYIPAHEVTYELAETKNQLGELHSIKLKRVHLNVDGVRLREDSIYETLVEETNLSIEDLRSEFDARLQKSLCRTAKALKQLEKRKSVKLEQIYILDGAYNITDTQLVSKGAKKKINYDILTNSGRVLYSGEEVIGVRDDVDSVLVRKLSQYRLKVAKSPDLQRKCVGIDG